MPKKVLISVIIIVIVFIIMMGIDRITSSRVNLEYEINPTVSKNIKFNEQKEGVEIVKYHNNYYVFIKWGSKSTGGYRMEIEKIETSGRNAKIYVKKYSPKLGYDVTDAVTFPYVTVMFNKKPNVKVIYNE